MSDLFEFVLAWLIFGMAAVLTWRAWKRESAPPHLDFIQKIKWWVVYCGTAFELGIFQNF